MVEEKNRTEEIQKSKKEKREHKERKVRVLGRMSTKIGNVLLAVLLIQIIVLISISITKTTKSMKGTYMFYAKNLAEEAAVGVDFAVESGENIYGNSAKNLAEQVVNDYEYIKGKEGIKTDELLGNVIGNVKLEGVESSYGYMVDSKGIMLYHPTPEKIGQPVENEAVKGIISELDAGKKVEDGYVIYEYKGAKKLAGYALTDNNDIVIVTADYDDFMKVDYDLLIGEISISEVEGSYAYMVSSDGTMLYHANSEKIGKPVENKAVKGIVSDLQAGKKVDSGAVIYNYKGEKKIAGYAMTEQNNIIVVTGDYATFLQPLTDIRNILIIVGVVMIIISAVVGILFVEIMMKPIQKIVTVISDTAKFKFKNSNNLDKLCKRKDEIGVIAEEVMTMRKNLCEIVGEISRASENIDSNVDQLLKISQNVNEICVDNSATSEELAAGMQETSASTITIATNISEMYENSKGIGELVTVGEKMSEEVMERAVKLRETTGKSARITMDIYSSVKEKSAAAMEASKAVDKINELTQTVMEISEQTSLLALNASIESARAGEGGKAFSVVATGISTLANQTTDAVNDINNIVAEVSIAVSNMNDSLSEVIELIENKVLMDYEGFGKVGIQYQEDAVNFKQTMDNIMTSIQNLNEMLDVVDEAIRGISDTMGEAAGGVSDIAEKTSDMVDGTIKTSDKVDDCRKQVTNLNGIIERFDI